MLFYNLDTLMMPYYSLAIDLNTKKVVLVKRVYQVLVQIDTKCPFVTLVPNGQIGFELRCFNLQYSFNTGEM